MVGNVGGGCVCFDVFDYRAGVHVWRLGNGLTNLTGLTLSGNQLSSIESGDFDGPTNLTWLYLSHNQLSSIESGDFDGLTNLTNLYLSYNQLSSIESGAFSGLTNLTELHLSGNTALKELNLEAADFSSLTVFDVNDNVHIASVSLRNTVLDQGALAVLLDGGFYYVGIGQLDGITEMDLSGVDFGDISDLEPLYAMDDLIDLWLVNTQNLNALDLDVLLDNLDTIEGTDIEGVLYCGDSSNRAIRAPTRSDATCRS